MSEHLIDDAAEVQRLFLWRDIVEVFRANADTLGLLPSFDDPTVEDRDPTRLVLAEAVPNNTFLSLQLWAELSESSFIAKACLLYLDRQRRERYCYAITPWDICQSSRERSPLDAKDLMELRMDVRDATWDSKLSEECTEITIL